jgi:hypothetical protein
VSREGRQRAAGQHVQPDQLARGGHADHDREQRRDDDGMRPDQRGRPIAETPLDRFAFVGLVDRALLLEDAFGRREPTRRSETGRLHETPQRAVTGPPGLLDTPAPRQRAREVREVPPPARGDIQCFLESTAEREVGDADRAHQERSRQDPQQRQEPVVLEHRGDRGTVLLVPLAAARTAGRCAAASLFARRLLADPHARERCHQDAVAGDPHAPAQVQVRVRAIEPLVPQARSLPRLARDQHRRRRHAQDLEDAVELPLVDLAGLQ